MPIFQLPPSTVPISPANPGSGSILGTDISCFPDLLFVQVSGFLNLANAILRRWQTPRGGLFSDPNYGTDLRDWVNASSTPTNLYQLASAAEAEAEKDPRVTSCVASAVYNANEVGFDVTAQIVTGAGPFTLVAQCTQIGIQLLSIQAGT